MAREREEHLVERRLVERERRDPDARAGQLGDRLGGLAGVCAWGR